MLKSAYVSHTVIAARVLGALPLEQEVFAVVLNGVSACLVFQFEEQCCCAVSYAYINMDPLASRIDWQLQTHVRIRY